MATGFYQNDSYVLPFCPLVAIPEGASGELAEPCQSDVDAAQAVAAYRRVEESCDEAELCVAHGVRGIY